VFGGLCRYFRYGFSFLLNFCNDLFRYYRHIRKISDYRTSKRVGTTMMSRSILSSLSAIGLVLTLASAAAAQQYQPFIEPGYFNHDLQFFAPASDIDTYGGDPVLRTGWFGSYNRMYIGVSRPKDRGYLNESGPQDILRTFPDSSDLMDLTWGNRWDLGYMIDDVDHDHGWMFSFMRIDGPSVGNVLRHERLNRLNEDDEGFVVDDEGAVDLDDVVNPPEDRNNVGPPNRQRFYDLTDSLNNAKLNSLELNKIFRLAPLHGGGTLEPFFGVRYIKFEDIFQRQNYMVYDEDGFSPLLPPLGPGSIPIVFEDAEIEDLMTNRFLFSNQIVTGQLGVRWLKRVSRWNLSTEFRAFGGQNFQHLTRTTENVRTYYDGQGSGSEVTAIVKSKETQDWYTTETVVGTDIRAIAAYEVTRDIKLEAGLQFLGFFTGMGRGPFIYDNSDAVTMVGTTFGFTINR